MMPSEKLEKVTVKNDLLDLIVKVERINDIRFLNKYFEEVNRKLKVGGLFKGNVETFSVRRMSLKTKFPSPLNTIYLFFDTILVRVLPKLRVTKNLYFSLTKGKGRVLSKAETYGRLYSCGFEIVEEELGEDHHVYSNEQPHAAEHVRHGPTPLGFEVAFFEHELLVERDPEH